MKKSVWQLGAWHAKQSKQVLRESFGEQHGALASDSSSKPGNDTNDVTTSAVKVASACVTYWYCDLDIIMRVVSA